MKNNNNRRYTIQTTASMRFYQMPKIFFTSDLYKKMTNNAKITYMLMSDRLQLSIKNSWTNENGEVYFVYPLEKLMEITDLSKPTVTKVKKELIDLNLLEEERTGRANRMYLLQPIATEDDFYEITKQELDIDHNSDKILRNEKGQITRSKENELQVNEVNKTRSQNIELQVETLSNQDLLDSNQKLKKLTTEVKNIYTNDTNLNKTEEEDINNNTTQNKSIIQNNDNNPVFRQLKTCGLFTDQEIYSIISQLNDSVNSYMIDEQLKIMSIQPRLLSPVKYFINGINKMIRHFEFKLAQMNNN